MISRNLIVVIILIIVSVIGFVLWYRTDSSTSPQQNNSILNQDIESDHNLETATADKPGFIEDLIKREFKGGEIKIEETVADNAFYTSYIFSYPSDDLTVYGRMNVPKENGPFPVIVLNHGYFNQSSFQSGDGTQTMADIMARQDYLTLASDYRGFGKSENDPEGSRGHNPNYAIDILNLIASIKNLPKADANRIGMWGHSMGGEVSLRVAEAKSNVKAIVLWAPTSARASDNVSFYSGGRQAPQANPGLEGASPINYLKYIQAPISLHQGSEDTEVKPEWSKELKSALEKENKTVEYFEYEGQDHNFKNLGWDLISERTIAFYDKYLKK